MQLSEALTNTLQNLQAVIFDMDGVLSDTEPMHVLSFKYFMDELGLDYEEEFIHGFIGYSIEDNIRTINKTFFHGRELDVAEGVLRRDAIYLKIIKENPIPVIPGVLELIGWLKDKNIPMALASSSARDQVVTILDSLTGHPQYQLNLHEIFRVTISGDDVLHRKPAPEIYKTTVQALNFAPANCLAIEDSPAGITSSQTAGLSCIALKNHYVSPDKTTHADLCVDHLSQVLSILQKYV